MSTRRAWFLNISSHPYLLARDSDFKKVDYLLKILRESSVAKPDTKPLLLVLVPTSPQIQRTIAVAEHLKHYQRIDGPRLYQYNTLHSILTPLKPVKCRLPNDNNREEGEVEESKTTATNLVDNTEAESFSDGDEPSAFQTMNSNCRKNKAAISPHGVKVRTYPIMTIFLASAPVPELRQYFQYVLRKFYTWCFSTKDSL